MTYESLAIRIYVTASIGNIVPECCDEAHAFIEMTDRRLYEAKQRGRDTIVSG